MQARVDEKGRVLRVLVHPGRREEPEEEAGDGQGQRELHDPRQPLGGDEDGYDCGMLAMPTCRGRSWTNW